ncbi:MAG: hypothetical protein EBT59_10130 [Betaproteobacteria bacterium]|nr:hypothetical protein [Betaproteobacteria bacterium]NBT99479.1 hypothetical protein [Betaproteobacteria bacterium]
MWVLHPSQDSTRSFDAPLPNILGLPSQYLPRWVSLSNAAAAFLLKSPPSSWVRRIGAKMRLLGWSLWGLMLLLSFYALWMAKQEIANDDRENWSPQALEDYSKELTIVGDAGLIVLLLCILWLLIWLIVR